MKTFKTSYRYILITSIFLAAAYTLPPLFGNKSSFSKKIPETDTRRTLITQKKKKSLYRKFVPVDSKLYSNYLYDYLIDSDFDGSLPRSNLITPDVYGKYRYTWRLKFSKAGTFSPKSNLSNTNFNLTLTDSYGLPLVASSKLVNLPDKPIQLKPGVYELRIYSFTPLDKFEFTFKTAGVGGWSLSDKLSIPTLNIKYSNADLRALKRLISLAKKNANDRGSQIIAKMPQGRIKASLLQKGTKFADARIGLSGRSIQHFTGGYPSIDVRISGGNTYMGIPSFKLYRLSTKSGLKDFVFSSILKDLGFIIPRQELVNVVVNGNSQGLFLLMETFNESTFTKQHRLDGNVIGVDTEKLFYDYHLGSELKLDYFYKISEDPHPLTSTSFFLSKDFVAQLNKDDFAKYIAFASIYYSAHGLGVDDLRFYKDPTTNKFIPIPRDLNPGLGSNYLQFIRQYVTQLGWLANNLFYTIDPAKNLEHEIAIQSGSAKSLTGFQEINSGLTDLHFTIVSFLSSSENLALTNRYLAFFAKNNELQNKIRIRTKNALEQALALEPQNKILLEQKKELETEDLPFMGPTIKRQVQINPPIIRNNKSNLYWNLRTSTSLDKTLMPSFFAPYRDVGVKDSKYEHELKNAFLVEQKIFEIISDNNFKPIKLTTRNIKESDENLKVIDINQHSLQEFPTEADKAPKPKNIVTYLGTLPIQSSDNLVLFIVRNATDDVKNFTLSKRKSFKRYTPSINYLFTLDKQKKAYSNIDQILKNKFPIGERYRLLAFKFKPSKETIFFHFNLPRSFPQFKRPQNAGWFGPSQMYLPANLLTSPQEKKNFTQNIPPIIKQENDTWTIPKNSKIEISKDLVIPTNISLIIEEGAYIKLKSGVSIILEGNLSIQGTKANPVKFEPSGNKPWGGIFVSSPQSKKVNVVIESTHFSRFGSFPKTNIGDMMLNGGLNFYKTHLSIDDVLIEDAYSEDAINLIYSQANISNLSIFRSTSDAIDLDYTNAEITNMLLKNNLGDGLDISGSLVKCTNCTFIDNKDKGVSIGEMSNFSAVNSQFVRNDMGLANKDQSRMIISNSIMENNRIAIAEFIKKPYFGRPSSQLKDNIYKNNGTNYKWLGLYIY